LAVVPGFDINRAAYVAGDYCGAPGNIDGLPECTFAGGDVTPFALFARRGDVVERVELSDVVSGAVDSPQEAALRALASGYTLLCPVDVLTFGPGSVTPVADGYDVVGYRSTCDAVLEATVHVSQDGQVEVRDERAVQDINCAVIGRLTAGASVAAHPRGYDCGRVGDRELGDYFARVAALEAVAVDAFERLADELAALGAPDELAAWARRSADDERRHARDMGALARRFGATPRAHQAQRFAKRDLFAVALENAVEGCVRETYGAVVGHHQAAHAQDHAVRAAMAQVAEDETRHAALSWAVAEWALPQLSAAQHQQLQQAQRAALVDLRRAVARPEAETLVRDAGLPTADAGLAMLDALQQQVWA
jgi:rubrerythrin